MSDVNKPSIRTKLLLQLSALLVVCFIAFIAIAINRAQAVMNILLDDIVSLRAKSFESLILFDPATGKLILHFDENAFPEFLKGDNDGLFQFRELRSGKVIFRSPSLEKMTIDDYSRRKLPEANEHGVFWNDWLAENEVYRCFRIEVEPRSVRPAENISGRTQANPRDFRISAETFTRPPLLELTLAWESDNAWRRLQQMYIYTMLLFCGMFFIVLYLTAYMLKAAFKPLAGLAGELERIDPLRPRANISVPGERETSVVGLAVNSLLSRLEKSLNWEREITANVAHELRTPIAALGNTLEVALSTRRSSGEYQDALMDSLTITRQMRYLVENLLELSRLESGQIKVLEQQFELRELLLECWISFEDQANSKNLKFSLEVPAECEVDTDRSKLKIILNNLLDNAVNYTPAGGSIEVAAVAAEAAAASAPAAADTAAAVVRGGALTICIKNSGTPLTADEIENIFKRFHRLSTARHESAHFGLGLNLSSSFCELLGIRLQAASEPNVALAVSLTIPAVDPAES